MLLRILSFFILLLSLMSCKKDETSVNQPCFGNCMIVNVRVGTDLNAATPVANANVEFSWSRPAYPLGNPGRLIAKGTTGNDGTIRFLFNAKESELKDGRFYVSVKKGNEYFEYLESFYDVEKADTVLNIKTHIPSKATIKIVFKNFNPQLSTDYFSCSPFYKSTNLSLIGLRMSKPNGEGANPWFSPTYGAFSSLEFSGVTAGNEYTYLSILKKINGNRIDLKDSIYIAKGDTKTYTIEYK